MRRDRETARGKISKRERRRTERRESALSAILSEAEHIIQLRNELNYVLGLGN